MKGYAVPPENKQMPKLGQDGSYVKYSTDVNPKPKDYISKIIEKAKHEPGPNKYSKVIKWTEANVKECPKWSKKKRISVFS